LGVNGVDAKMKLMELEDVVCVREEGERCCGVKGMETLESEGVDIDDEAGASKARVLTTPVSIHFTRPTDGKMVGETSFPACNDGSYFTEIASDSC
jgi:hypothetical protein